MLSGERGLTRLGPGGRYSGTRPLEPPPPRDVAGAADPCPREPARIFPPGAETEIEDGQVPCRAGFRRTGVRLTADRDGSRPDPGPRVVRDSRGRTGDWHAAGARARSLDAARPTHDPGVHTSQGGRVTAEKLASRPLAGGLKVLGLIVFGFALSSCGDGTESTSPGALERWSVSEDPSLVIGGAGARGNDILYRVVGASRLSDGRIAIADVGSSEVKYFDSRGRHLLDAGGEEHKGPARNVDDAAHESPSSRFGSRLRRPARSDSLRPRRPVPRFDSDQPPRDRGPGVQHDPNQVVRAPGPVHRHGSRRRRG